LLKFGPVEAGKVNTSGTGGGGGHRNASGFKVSFAAAAAFEV
jgi:oligoribonuclease NrnB/cAMP/cGMP phosphodiesterase (DHH superfamily)